VTESVSQGTALGALAETRLINQVLALCCAGGDCCCELQAGGEMRNLTSLTADRILAIRRPESLFSMSLSESKLEYRELAQHWHPDNAVLPEAHLVFARIAELYRQARVKLNDGTWKEPGEKVDEEVRGIKKFRLADGSTRAIEFIAVRSFELGQMFIGDHHVTFEVQEEFADLFRNARRQLRHLKFQDHAMAVEMSKFLPQIVDDFRTTDSCVLVVHKTPDQVLLSDVLAYFGGKVHPIEHVGWILNVLYNLSCYLEWCRITHNAISPGTIFISPVRHSGMLLGGWWYSVESGERLSIVPDRSVEFIPPDIIRNKRADIRIDLELIKSVGRELLGDVGGEHLILDESIPEVLVEWLRLPSSGFAANDYAAWKYGILPETFGRPKFVDLKLDRSELYKEV
jgi:hypothetical protein